MRIIDSGRSTAEIVELQDKINQLNWFHSIDFGDGILSPGKGTLAALSAQAAIYFPESLTGKTILDIGCWDGFYSLAAARQNAARVLATDHFAWSPEGWGDRRAFDLVQKEVAPDIEVLDIMVEDLSVDRVGNFDIVLFSGVFYHLRHPFLILESVARLANETFIVETVLDALSEVRPAMIFYPGTELGGDKTNWWGPNRPCVEAMLRDVGFGRVDFDPHPTIPQRGSFRATR